MNQYPYIAEMQNQPPTWTPKTSPSHSDGNLRPINPMSEMNYGNINTVSDNEVPHGGLTYDTEGNIYGHGLIFSANAPAAVSALNASNSDFPVYRDTWEGRPSDNEHNFGGDEEVEDVSTWSLDTIREVASDLHQASRSGHHHAVLGPTNSSPLLLQAHNNPLIPNWGATSEPKLVTENSWNMPNSDSPGEVLIQSGAIPNPGSQEPRRRKLKMYQWPPQQDPKMEKKRLRAIKQFKKRLEEEQEERQLERCLTDTTRELPSLRQQVLSYRQKVDDLEYQLANSLTLSHQHDHGQW